MHTSLIFGKTHIFLNYSFLSILKTKGRKRIKIYSRNFARLDGLPAMGVGGRTHLHIRLILVF